MAIPSQTEAVSADEVRRRLDEYRRIGFERRLPVQVVYQDPHVACPWPDCDYRINAIQFNVEKWPNLESQLRKSWWRGPGLVGRCPKCGRHVLFGVTSKSKVQDLTDLNSAMLPDDWFEKAHLVTKPKQHASQN